MLEALQACGAVVLAAELVLEVDRGELLRLHLRLRLLLARLRSRKNALEKPVDEFLLLLSIRIERHGVKRRLRVLPLLLIWAVDVSQEGCQGACVLDLDHLGVEAHTCRTFHSKCILLFRGLIYEDFPLKILIFHI